MQTVATQLAQGLRTLVTRHALPWCVTQVGARTEFQFTPTPPRNGTEAGARLDAELEHLIHLGPLNRGVLITPFHNMTLVCPHSTPRQVEQLLAALEAVVLAIAPA